MKVSIDISGVYTNKAGTARYIKSLVHALTALKEPELEIHPIAWPVYNLNYEQPLRSIKTFYRDFVWRKYEATRLLENIKQDLHHSPAGYYIDTKCSPIIVTLLDLAVIRYPERFRMWQRNSALHRLRFLSKAALVLTISKFVGKEAHALLGISEDRIRPIPLASHLTLSHELKLPNALIPPEFFIFVGSLEPGKNLELLRETWLLASAQRMALPALVVVGARWSGVAREGVWPRSWVSLDNCDDNQLCYLYRNALALLFPSKYEGFGLPPLEAMTLGCPVITSRMASIPEVCENAAIYAEQTPQSYLEKIKTIIANSSLRSDLIANGLEQGKKFSWENTAQMTLKAYREILR